MTYLNLADAPEYIPLLADWHHTEWATLNPGQTLEQRIESMQAFLTESLVPSMFISLYEGQLAASAAIVACDMESRPEWSPWLASVYVKPEFRRRGLGSALVTAVMNHAQQQGLSALYLFTPDQASFYEQLGWQFLEKTRYRDHAVTVMRMRLRTNESQIR